MNRRIAALSLTAAILCPTPSVHGQQTHPDNRKELQRISLLATMAGAALVVTAGVRGDWETRRCPSAGESWREVMSYDLELCVLLLNEELADRKPKPDWTLTAMGAGLAGVGVFTYLLSRRFPKSPDVSISITPTGARISHTVSW